MKKIISFSLYNSLDKYNIGILKNIELQKTIYKDWEIWIYYDTTVNINFISKLKKYKNIKLFNMSNSLLKNHKMIWRFLPINDKNVYLFIVRDCDSRFTQREENAVLEWINSNKLIHVIRDHPNHKSKYIQGGMWGYKNYLNYYNINNSLKFWIYKYKKEYYFLDIYFITFIFKNFKDRMLVHDNWLRCKNSIKFKDKREKKEFVGLGFNIIDGKDVAIWQDNRWKYDNDEWIPLN